MPGASHRSAHAASTSARNICFARPPRRATRCSSSRMIACFCREPLTVSLGRIGIRSEEHTSELQSLMRISYAVFCLKKKKTNKHNKTETPLEILTQNVHKTN